MGFVRNKEIQDSNTNGQYWYSSFRKILNSSSVQGTWVDLSVSSGSPIPNYYATDALTSAILLAKNGLYHGADVFPKTKHLHKLSLCGYSGNVVPATFTLCDYLLYYPLIDMDSTDEQFLQNTITLPRYSDGLGVKAFLVATNPYIGGAQFSISYTNENGESGRRSMIHTSNTSTSIGTIVHSGTLANTSNFILLQANDKGIRSIESITFLSPNGGLAALVLVKPLVTILAREIGIFSEFDYFTMKQNMPRIYDGAYLNLLCSPFSNLSGSPIFGDISVIWN